MDQPSRGTVLWDTIGLGTMLWLLGFGFALAIYPFIALTYIGWCVLAIIVPITGYVAARRLATTDRPVKHMLKMSVAWVGIAAAADYKILVQQMHVTNYYKPDVYIYYAFTFLLPILVGLRYRYLKKQTNH